MGLPILKVANVIEEGRYGGPQARIVCVAEKLTQMGIETLVVLPIANSIVFLHRLAVGQIPYRQISLHRLTRQKYEFIKSVILFIPEIYQLYRLLKKERIKIVHCNSPWQFKGVIAGKFAHVKTVWHLNNTEMSTLLKVVFRIMAVLFCDAFIVAGERAGKYHLNAKWICSKPKIEIQASVDTAKFNPQTTNKDDLLGSFKGIKIVTVGNINRAKGLDVFVKMAGRLSSDYRNLRFIIVGPVLETKKDYYHQLVQMIKKMGIDNICFYGFADNVASVLKACDIYVCSSRTEASPTSVWEAMSMAKPIVSTDVGDVARFIQDGENGFVVPTGDANALAEKVKLLIDNEKFRRVFGKCARETAVNYLDVDVCARKHSEFYRKIAQ